MWHHPDLFNIPQLRDIPYIVGGSLRRSKRYSLICEGIVEGLSLGIPGRSCLEPASMLRYRPSELKQSAFEGFFQEFLYRASVYGPYQSDRGLGPLMGFIGF